MAKTQALEKTWSMGSLGQSASQRSRAGLTGGFRERSLQRSSSAHAGIACPIPRCQEQESSNHYQTQPGRAERPSVHQQARSIPPLRFPRDPLGCGNGSGEKNQGSAAEDEF